MFHRGFFPRQIMSLPAWIEVNSSSLLERCKVMDLSESGARLGISDVRNLPPQFNLYLARIGQSAINVESFGNGGMKLEWSSSLVNRPTMPQSPQYCKSEASGGYLHRFFSGVPQHIATTPHGFDVVFATRGAS
jgi:hypothetical protein